MTPKTYTAEDIHMARIEGMESERKHTKPSPDTLKFIASIKEDMKGLSERIQSNTNMIKEERELREQSLEKNFAKIDERFLYHEEKEKEHWGKIDEFIILVENVKKDVEGHDERLKSFDTFARDVLPVLSEVKEKLLPSYIKEQEEEFARKYNENKTKTNLEKFELWFSVLFKFAGFIIFLFWLLHIINDDYFSK